MEAIGPTIVLALDGSDHSLVGRDLLARLRWPAGTTVHIVTAFRAPDVGGVLPTVDHPGAYVAARDAETRIAAATAAHLPPLQNAGLATEIHVVSGRAASVILAKAAEVGADLIVTGSRGHSGLKSLLLGSVASELASEARCSVLVARQTRASRIVIATDGSESAAAIPARLAEWGALRDASTYVVSVATPDPVWFDVLATLYAPTEQDGHRRRDALREEAQRHADEMVESLAALGMEASAQMVVGDAATQIVAAAEEAGAELIVTGSRGLGSLERVLLGSVARDVLQAVTCSVLVMRPT
jgi:nucleotide-binding universal stress UspA family protein